MARAMSLVSSTTKVPTAVVVRRYFATSKNTLPRAFRRSQFTWRHYTTKWPESNRADGFGVTIPQWTLMKADKVIK